MLTQLLPLSLLRNSCCLDMQPDNLCSPLVFPFLVCSCSWRSSAGFQVHHLPVDSFEFTEFDCLHFSDCKLDFHFCIKFGTFLDTIPVLFIIFIFVGVFSNILWYENNSNLWKKKETKWSFLNDCRLAAEIVLLWRYVKTTEEVSVSHSNFINWLSRTPHTKSAKISTPALPLNLGVRKTLFYFLRKLLINSIYCTMYSQFKKENNIHYQPSSLPCI